MPDVQLVLASPTTILHRIASLRGDGPLGWPSLAFVRANGGGTGRFDDPRSEASEYDVMYASPELRTCFIETLDQFRPDASFIARVARTMPREEAGASDDLESLLTAEIPERYFAKRIGSFRIERAASFLDVRLAATQTALTLSRDPEVAEVLDRLGYRRMTPSDFVGSVRVLTQMVSLWAFRRGLAGIVYNSCHEPREGTCWALFSGQHIDIAPAGPLTKIDRHDPELQTVAQRFGLTIPRGGR
jgi:hypothetical protein